MIIIKERLFKDINVSQYVRHGGRVVKAWDLSPHGLVLISSNLVHVVFCMAELTFHYFKTFRIFFGKNSEANFEYSYDFGTSLVYFRNE